MSNVANRTIFIRDHLDVVRGINSAPVDLIYLGHPFNSKCCNRIKGARSNEYLRERLNQAN